MAVHNQMKPYQLTQAIDLRFSDVADTIDDTLELRLEDAGEDDAGARRLDLRASRWNGLVLTIEARLDPAKLTEVLAGGSESAGETRMIVSVRCPKTKLRRVATLVSDSDKRGVWAGEIVLHRRDVRSRLEFHPLLYRLTEIPGSARSTPAQARHRFALLATGRPVTAAIDDVERGPAGPIKIKWQDFSDGNNPWLDKHRQTMYYFEYDDKEPVLWLNKRNKNLRALLFERTQDTVDSALRRLMSGWLAETVWLQLFQAAVGSLAAESEEEVQVLPDGWRGNVLRIFLVHMFPEQDVSAGVAAMIEAKSSPTQFGAMMGKASTVVQRVVGSDRLFADAVRAAEKGTPATGRSST